jgi:hypothetical protein
MSYSLSSDNGYDGGGFPREAKAFYAGQPRETEGLLRGLWITFSGRAQQ